MAKRKVTLYIEDTEIKVLVSRGRKIENWASYSLEPSLVRDGAIMDEARVADAIKELFRLQKISDKKITLALTGLNSIFRIITLPELPAKMVPEAIINEASRVIPMPLEEVYLSHQIISPKQSELRVFLAAYPKSFTDALVRTLNKAGLRVDVMDLAPLALARTVNESRAVIINSWLSNLDIVILSDGLPRVVRSISLSGEDMAPEEKINSVMEEFNRTVSFYNSNNKDNPLDESVPVYICGDLTQNEPLWQAINLNMLNYNISTMSPPVQAPEAFIPCQYMINVGLALKGNLPGGDGNHFSIVDFNALPEAHIPPSFSLYRIMVPVGAATGLLALLFFWLIIQDINRDIDRIKDQTASLNAEQNEIRSQINPIRDAIGKQEESLEAMPAKIDSIENEILRVKDLTQIFDDAVTHFEDGLKDTSEDVPELFTLKPDAIKLSSVDYRANSINLNGTSRTQSAIFEYARALRSSDRFNWVSIPQITEAGHAQLEGEEVKLYSFTMVVR